MASPGRPKSPLENAQHPIERFAWLIRALRSESRDTDITTTRVFSTRLNDHLARPLSPDSINKMERGTGIFFTVDKARAYERVLNLEYASLIDLFIFASRAGKNEVNWNRDLVNDYEIRFYDGLHSLGAGETLPASELLGLTVMAKRDHPESLESKWGEVLAKAVMDLYGKSYEREERLLGEALIHLGDAAIPFILERAEQKPLAYFNSIEALGYMKTEAAWDALRHFAGMDYESIRTQTIVHPIREWLTRRPDLVEDETGSIRKLAHEAFESVIDPLDAYTSREENLQLIRLLRVNPIGSQARKWSNALPEIEQLEMKEVKHSRRALLNYLSEEAGEAGMNRVPGLTSIIGDAIYTPDRFERLSVGALLGVLPTLDPVLGRVGRVLTQDPDVGVQRSIIRLMAKSESPSGLRAVSDFAATTKIDDEGVKLATVWALGMSDDARDEDTLATLQKGATSTTQAVVKMSVRRRGFEVSD